MSCSLLIDTKTKQCDSDADCAVFDNDSGSATCSAEHVCLAASGPLPAQGCEEPEQSSEDTVTLSFAVSLTSPPAKAADRKPFTIHACNTVDPTCDTPVTDDIRVAYGDMAQVELPPGFAGYLEVTNPDGLSAMEFLGRPINQDTSGYDLIIPTPGTVQLLAQLADQTYSADAGLFVVTTRDCDRQPLAGVTVQNTLGGTPFIFQNMLPQTSLTETNDEGAAGFINVPEGIGSVSATLAGRAMTGTSAFSRAGWVSYVEIFP